MHGAPTRVIALMAVLLLLIGVAGGGWSAILSGSESGWTLVLPTSDGGGGESTTTEVADSEDISSGNLESGSVTDTQANDGSTKDIREQQDNACPTTSIYLTAYEHFLTGHDPSTLTKLTVIVNASGRLFRRIRH